MNEEYSAMSTQRLAGFNKIVERQSYAENNNLARQHQKIIIPPLNLHGGSFNASLSGTNKNKQFRYQQNTASPYINQTSLQKNAHSRLSHSYSTPNDDGRNTSTNRNQFRK